MVWPAAPGRFVDPPDENLSYFEPPRRRLSLRASSPFSSSPSSEQDWHHQRQQQWLDRIPLEPSPQHEIPRSSSSSSLPSTARFTMPGSYYSEFDSGSPSEEEEDLFRLAHDASPSWHSTNPRSARQDDAPPFFPPSIPSAQPRSSSIRPPSSSPPPFTNISYSTQAASSLPSPPSSQHERPWSPPPLSAAASSQSTLRQGTASQQQQQQQHVASPPMSPLRRPVYHNNNNNNNNSRGRGVHGQTSDEVDAQALNAVVDGIGRMQVNMNLDQAGRWRIARRTDAPW